MLGSCFRNDKLDKFSIFSAIPRLTSFNYSYRNKKTERLINCYTSKSIMSYKMWDYEDLRQEIREKRMKRGVVGYSKFDNEDDYGDCIYKIDDYLDNQNKVASPKAGDESDNQNDYPESDYNF